jgi:transcriptional regulator with XRE-family HTH domain
MAGASAPDPGLASTLRRLREERGITREALAHRADVTIGTLAHLELAQSDPKWSTVRQIASALGLSVTFVAASVEASDAGGA